MPLQTNRSFIENYSTRLLRGQRTSIVDYDGEAIRARKRFFLKVAPSGIGSPDHPSPHMAVSHLSTKLSQWPYPT
jgi:hypothetical protein